MALVPVTAPPASERGPVRLPG